MKKLHHLIPGRAARLLLRITLSLTVLVGIAFLISYWELAKTAPATAAYQYRAMLEYLLGSVTLAFGGALLVELIGKETAKK